MLETFAGFGARTARELQAAADLMSGTELYEQERFIPDFAAAVEHKNMLERDRGFTCRSSAGRIVRLIQQYDSEIYTAEPEDLPALWGFKWSKDPAKALPFIALSTSPYMTGDCCTDLGGIYRSKMDNNVFSPGDYPDGWERVEVEVQGNG